MASPPIPRDQLSRFLSSQREIKAFEKILKNGSLATQEADSVVLTGGTINGVVIGATDPQAANFTTVGASGQITSAVLPGTAPLVVASNTEVTNLRAALATLADVAALANLATLATLANAATALATPRTIGGVSFNGTANITVQSATGDFTISLKFGCNGAAPQAAAASGGAVATTGATNVTPYGYTTAAQANDIVTKLNAIRAALVANGIMS